MECEKCKHKDKCEAYKTNNKAIINRCNNATDIKGEKPRHIKDSTELSGGHLW